MPATERQRRKRADREQALSALRRSGHEFRDAERQRAASALIGATARLGRALSSLPDLQALEDALRAMRDIRASAGPAQIREVLFFERQADAIADVIRDIKAREKWGARRPRFLSRLPRAQWWIEQERRTNRLSPIEPSGQGRDAEAARLQWQGWHRGDDRWAALVRLTPAHKPYVDRETPMPELLRRARAWRQAKHAPNPLAAYADKMRLSASDDELDAEYETYLAARPLWDYEALVEDNLAPAWSQWKASPGVWASTLTLCRFGFAAQARSLPLSCSATTCPTLCGKTTCSRTPHGSDARSRLRTATTTNRRKTSASVTAPRTSIPTTTTTRTIAGRRSAATYKRQRRFAALRVSRPHRARE